jgi:hypothetical protein
MSELTDLEQANVRAALRFLHAKCGTWALVVATLGSGKAIVVSKVASGHKSASAALAVRVARAVGAPVDDVLQGRFPGKDVCPNCGQRMQREEVFAS